MFGLVIGENRVIGPMPFLLMYSQEGVLCFYHIINLFPNAPALCKAPQLLPDQSGIHLFSEVQVNMPFPFLSFEYFFFSISRN